MASQIRVIKTGDKLRTTKDVYIDGKLIPANKDDFYAYSTDPIAVSGFGPNLVWAIKVTKGSRRVALTTVEVPGQRGKTQSIYAAGSPRVICLPLECLALAE